MFDPGCEIKTDNLVNVPVTFVDGVVSDLEVSGNLTYVSGLVIPNTTVYLKSQGDDSVIATTAADGSGDFEFAGVVPGDYYLDASTTTPSQSPTSLDAVTVFYTYLTLTGLYELASDVNEDGIANTLDAAIIYYSWFGGSKVPDWTAPDWIFENPTFSVVVSDIVQDFEGISSGDANGDYIP